MTGQCARPDHHGVFHHNERHQPSCGHAWPGRRPVVHATIGNNIGRITTGGDHRVLRPKPAPVLIGITAGPDGDLWFTEYSGNKIGRITTAGVITEYPIQRPAQAVRDRGWPGRRPVVHGVRGDKIGRITTAGASPNFLSQRPAPTRMGSRRGRTATCGSPSSTATRSGASRLRACHRVSHRPGQPPFGSRRAGRQPVVHRVRREQDRADHHGGRDH